MFVHDVKRQRGGPLEDRLGRAVQLAGPFKLISNDSGS